MIGIEPVECLCVSCYGWWHRLSMLALVASEAFKRFHSFDNDGK